MPGSSGVLLLNPRVAALTYPRMSCVVTLSCGPRAVESDMA